MKSILRFFVIKSFYVHLITALIVLLGAISVLNLNRDIIPAFEWNSVTINASLIGASPEEIEKFVTFPLEEALAGLPGMERHSSHSGAGYVSIDVFFKPEFENMNEAVQSITDKINSVRSRLPMETRDLHVRQNKVTDVFLLWMGLENFDQKNTEHRKFYKDLEEALLKVPGIVQARSDFRERNLHIKFDLDKLARYEVTVEQAQQAIRNALSLAPIGVSNIKNTNYMVTIKRAAKDLESIQSLPLLSNTSGNTLLLSDVAKVEWELVDRKDIGFINGKPGITFSISKAVGTDSINVRNEAWKVVEKHQALAPAGVKVVNLADGPQFIERQMNILNKNGLVGLILVFFILLMFLNWRTATMATLGLPIAYFGTFVVLSQMGVDINLISIVGMILVLGILVDDAIIVSERYMEQLESGNTPQKSAINTTSELMVPVTGTVLTTVVAFAPILFIKGGTSKMLASVPIVVLSALALSWFESFFILPNHLAHFVKTPGKKRNLGVFLKLKAFYAKTLWFVLKWRYPFVGASIALIALAGFLYTKLESNFGLSINSERVAITVVLEESLSAEDTAKQLKPLLDFVNTEIKKDVENTVTFIGDIWMEGKSYTGPQYAKMLAYLDRNHQSPSRLKRKLKDKLNPFIEEMKASKKFKRVFADIEASGSDEEAKKSISLFITGGEDLDFEPLEKKFIEAIPNMKAIADYNQDDNRFTKNWRFVPDSAKLIQYQMTTAALAAKIRSFFVSDQILETRLHGERVYINSEIGNKEELTLEKLENLSVVTSLGTNVPLKFLGAWEQIKTLSYISHENGERTLSLQFRLAEGSNYEAGKKDLEALIGKIHKDYSGFKMTTEPTNRQETESAAWAQKVAIICIVGILFVMAFILGSITQPLIVGLPIPFGFVGVTFALFAHQYPMGLMALIGLVGTLGVAVNASIVMMDQINRLSEKSGVLDRATIIEGATSRFRAILLTTLTTIGGIFPMAYGIGGESGFTQPLVFSMGWGLISATIMTALFIPAFLEIRNDCGKGLFWIKKKLGKKATLNEELLQSPSRWEPVIPPQTNPESYPIPPNNTGDGPQPTL